MNKTYMMMLTPRPEMGEMMSPQLVVLQNISKDEALLTASSLVKNLKERTKVRWVYSQPVAV